MGPTVRDFAIRSLELMAEQHGGYAYYGEDITGLKALIEDKLLPLARAPKLSFMWYWHPFDSTPTYGMYTNWSFRAMGPLVEVRPAGDNSTFHEMIHAYEDLELGKLAADVAAPGIMHEWIAEGAETMEHILREHLQGLEDELGKPTADPASSGVRWRKIWIIAHIGAAGERIKNDLGFHVSCGTLAAFYNDHAKWPSVKKSCIVFECKQTPFYLPYEQPQKSADGLYHLGHNQEKGLPPWLQ